MGLPNIYVIANRQQVSENQILQRKLNWYLGSFRRYYNQISLYTGQAKLESGDIGIVLDANLAAGFDLSKLQLFNVDANSNTLEGAMWLYAGNSLVIDQSPYLRDSARKWSKLSGQLSGRPSLLLGTGPTIDNLSVENLSKYCVIACNSIVKSRELMDKFQPDIVVFTDPIFHAGWSDYAKEFREALTERFTERPFWMICNARDQYVFRGSLPKGMIERLIAVPQLDTHKFNNDIQRNFWVRSSNNVLTLMMLPVAASLSQEISLAGFDGRPLDANDYFWTHGAKAQFQDKLTSIKADHPAFFNISYDDYYGDFVADCEGIFKSLERAGAQIKALSPSHNPALVKRGAEPLSLSALPKARSFDLLHENNSEIKAVTTKLDENSWQVEFKECFLEGHYWSKVIIKLHKENDDTIIRLWPRDCEPFFYADLPSQLPRHPKWGPVFTVKKPDLTNQEKRHQIFCQMKHLAVQENVIKVIKELYYFI